jgi:hypothetical protein
MYYDQLITQWFERSTTEEDIFTKFIFLYISFNAFLTQANKGENDRQKINSLKYDTTLREFYLKLINTDSDLKQKVEKLIIYLRRQPIQNVTRLDDPNWRGRDGVIENKHDWTNIVEFWYRVRNNLFHGHKAPEFKRDRMLVSYAYSTLHPIMKNFIDHDLHWDFS